METEKGQFSSFKLDAILGLKYNHENKYSHNFLVQFRNTNWWKINLKHINILNTLKNNMMGFYDRT